MTDWLVLAGSLCLSLEYALALLLPSVPVTLSWAVFPLIVLLSIPKRVASYLAPSQLKWVALVAAPVLLYAIANYPSDGVRASMHVRSQVRMAFTSVIVLWFFSANVRTSQARRSYVTGLVVGTGIAVALRSSALLFPDPSRMRYGTVAGTEIVRLDAFGDPNITTAYLLAGVSAAPILMRLVRGYRPVLMAVPVALLAGSFVTTVAAGSRGGLVALLVTLAVAIALSLKHSRDNGQRIVLTAVLLAACVACATLLDSYEPFVSSLRLRLAYGSSGQDASIDTRVASWKWLASDLVTRFRIIGCGYERFAYGVGPFGLDKWPHASLIDSYIVGGVPLLLVWLALWLRAARNAWRAIRQPWSTDRETALILLSLLCGLFVLFTGLSHLWMNLIWATLAVCGTLGSRHRERRRGTASAGVDCLGRPPDVALVPSSDSSRFHA